MTPQWTGNLSEAKATSGLRARINSVRQCHDLKKCTAGVNAEFLLSSIYTMKLPFLYYWLTASGFPIDEMLQQPMADFLNTSLVQTV